MYAVTEVRPTTSLWGETSWLLELADGRAALIQWVGQSLVGRLADTTIRELWSFEFGRRDQEGQVVAKYLPDEKSHDWQTTRRYLEEKFLLPEEADDD